MAISNLYREVVPIYQQALLDGLPPTMTVAKSLGISYGAAVMRIYRARQAGIMTAPPMSIKCSTSYCIRKDQHTHCAGIPRCYLEPGVEDGECGIVLPVGGVRCSGCQDDINRFMMRPWRHQ